MTKHIDKTTGQKFGMPAAPAPAPVTLAPVTGLQVDKAGMPDPFASIATPSADLDDDKRAAAEMEAAKVEAAKVEAAEFETWRAAKAAAALLPPAIVPAGLSIRLPADPLKHTAEHRAIRLRWAGKPGNAQKGNSAGYNSWQAAAGTYTVEQALAAGIPPHHLNYVTGQGWSVRA